MLRSIQRDFSISATVAGLIALIATFSGPVLLVVQAAKAGGLSAELLSTWIWALSIGSAVLGLWLSIRFKIPVIGAWSTPSVALLIYGLAHYSFSDVIGCYLLLTIAITFLGVSGLFTRLMALLPTEILSAMIAGVIFQFCAKIFLSLQSFPDVVLPIIIVYVACRRILPRYAVAFSLLAGLTITLLSSSISTHPIDLILVSPVLTKPTFSIDAIAGLGIPLLLLALTQYATGITVLRNAGFEVSPKMIVGASGLVSIPLSLFGSSGINPAAIVGALCASPECHDQPERRYIAGVVCGLGYLCIGAFGASVAALFSMLPNGLIATLAGLALLGTLASSLSSSLANDRTRDPALITFIVTVSGMSFFGLGSALWGLFAGIVFSKVLTANWNSTSWNIFNKNLLKDLRK